jgi:hypothetical protein
MDLAHSVARGDENRRHKGSTFRESVRSTFAFACDELSLDEREEYNKSASYDLFKSVLAKYFV